MPNQHFTGFRIHSRVAYSAQAWIEIWYLCRALDPKGKGWVQVPMEQLCQMTAREPATIYRWLNQGRRSGGFRQYKKTANGMRIHYASLANLCRKLELDDWGATATVPPATIRHLRDTACEVETQHQQQASQFAAKKALSKKKRHHKLHPVEDLVDKSDSPRGAMSETATSHKAPTRKSINSSVIHRGKRRVFTGATFVPYGASQRAIAQTLGCCDRTVRNHQKQIAKKQILQTKPGYKLIAGHKRYGLGAGDGDTYLTTHWNGSEYQLRLYDQYGCTGIYRNGGEPFNPQRLTKYFGETWIYRCNLYRLDHELTSMRTARKRYSESLRLRKTSRLRGVDLKIGVEAGAAM